MTLATAFKAQSPKEPHQHRVQVNAGHPTTTDVWSYTERHGREVHVYIKCASGEIVQIQFRVPLAKIKARCR